MLNLMSEYLIRMTTLDGETLRESLPGIYAMLAADDEVVCFPALRPHQHHAWHALLVGLGVMALRRSGTNLVPTQRADWAEALRGLVPDSLGDIPWHLVVDDITMPAFLQPPALHQHAQDDYRIVAHTPDSIDVLIASRNHVLKTAMAKHAEVDDWLFALVTTQTMGGFQGAGTYGISRMNGGLGSRPAFSLVPDGCSPGAHLRRDIAALLSGTTLPEVQTGDHELMWLLPWHGTKQEQLKQENLAPFYIEVCRRIRLQGVDGSRLHAVRASSTASRVDNTKVKGRTGDPWTPHNPARDGLPLTLTPIGFTYRRLTDFLCNWDLPILCRPTDRELKRNEPMLVQGKCLVRGQGKTEGYHECTIRIRPQTLHALRADSGERDDLRTISKAMLEHVTIVKGILNHALRTYAARGDSQVPSVIHYDTQPWLERFDACLQTSFFECLQDEFESRHNETVRKAIHDAWLLASVVEFGRLILHEAIGTIPIPVSYRYGAQVNAESVFEGRLRSSSDKGMGFLYKHESPEEYDEEEDTPLDRDEDSEWAKWNAQVFSLVKAVTQLSIYDTHDLEDLRRMMDPGKSLPAVFWRLVYQEDLPVPDEWMRRKWALVLCGMAHMTLEAGGDLRKRSSHNHRMPVGRFLYWGPTQRAGWISPMRLNQFLCARGARFHSLLLRLFSSLTHTRAAFDWREMARLIVSEGAEAHDARRRVATYYQQAQRQEQKEQGVKSA